MSLNLFRVGTIDYTNKIIEGSFDIQKKDIVDSWIDANRIERRNIVRTRIEGKFNMRFLSKSAYSDFLANLQSVKTREGYYPCVVYCNNTQNSEPANLFIDFAPVLRQNESLQLSYDEFSVTIMER